MLAVEEQERPLTVEGDNVVSKVSAESESGAESVPVEVVEEVPADGEQEAAAVEEEKKELSRYSRGVGSGEVGRTKGMNFKIYLN